MIVLKQSGAKGIHLHHDRLGSADSISERYLAPAGKARRHKVLGDVSGHVCAGAVYLSWIFPGKSAAPMRNHASVGIRHKLSPGQAGICFRASQHEPSRWLIRILVSSSGGSGWRAGNSTLSVNSQQSSSCSNTGLCWAETTTVSKRRGFPSSPYSTVTWAFPSGLKPWISPYLRARARDMVRRWARIQAEEAFPVFRYTHSRPSRPDPRLQAAVRNLPVRHFFSAPESSLHRPRYRALLVNQHWMENWDGSYPTADKTRLTILGISGSYRLVISPATMIRPLAAMTSQATLARASWERQASVRCRLSNRTACLDALLLRILLCKIVSWHSPFLFLGLKIYGPADFLFRRGYIIIPPPFGRSSLVLRLLLHIGNCSRAGLPHFLTPGCRLQLFDIPCFLRFAGRLRTACCRHWACRLCSCGKSPVFFHHPAFWLPAFHK